MKYTLCQLVRIVDMNDEILTEVIFEHAEVDTPQPVLGATVITHQLGLRQFDVVYDLREGKTMRSKITDMEIDLLGDSNKTRVYLESVKLIVGQHDVGVV